MKPRKPVWITRITCQHDWHPIDWITEEVEVCGETILNYIGTQWMCSKCAAIREDFVKPKPIHPWLSSGSASPT